jgi:hypothetical protein
MWRQGSRKRLYLLFWGRVSKPCPEIWVHPGPHRKITHKEQKIAEIAEYHPQGCEVTQKYAESYKGQATSMKRRLGEARKARWFKSLR